MKNRTEELLPVAREQGLIVEELTAEEVLVYDRERHKAHCLNHTAALVWRRCDGLTTVSEMAGLLEIELKMPVDDEIVWMALDQLGKSHLLDDRATRPAGKVRMYRREVIKRLGWAAAVALPLVSTILAPRAVEAVTCAVGSPCSTPTNCIGCPIGICDPSNHCT